ncbi:hypothetical protein GHI93_04590 [Lactococcus hircilactis]|uniref:Uncharacterized protein n=1 Tax=Lactococcus hircilactis TaxID=1494462 RepID=A0A7X2D179_9LACT|nr:hypothetical protein [Lactococcus hircilactis]MQW39217.1 hypothetical protein [Lactococcus hircilactis]
MKTTKIIAATGILVLLIAGGATYGIIQHDNAVHAANVKHDKLVKTEKTNLEVATAAVEQAYKSRKAQDIKTTYTAIDKLDKNQQKDKTSLSDKMTKLNGFLSQIAAVNTALQRLQNQKLIQTLTQPKTL